MREERDKWVEGVRVLLREQRHAENTVFFVVALNKYFTLAGPYIDNFFSLGVLIGI